MDTYNATADFLNKFSQLTPWVQVTLGSLFSAMVASVGFFCKEIVRVIAERLKK